MLLDLTTWKDAAAFVVTSGTIIGAAWKFVVQPIRRVFKKLERHGAVLDSIQKEFHPNGGKSMRDEMNWQSHTLRGLDLRLAIHEGRHRALLHCLDIACWESDAEGRCVAVNQKLSQLTGMTIDQMRGMGWVNCLFEDDRGKVVKEWKHAVEQGREFMMSYRIVCAEDRSVIQVRGHAYPVFHLDGQVVSFIGTIIEQLKQQVHDTVD